MRWIRVVRVRPFQSGDGGEGRVIREAENKAMFVCKRRKFLVSVYKFRYGKKI